MRKIISVILVLLMITSIITPVFALENSMENMDRILGDPHFSDATNELEATAKLGYSSSGTGAKPEGTFGYDPSTVSGALVWYDLTDQTSVTLNGTKIEGLANKATTGAIYDAAQLTAASQPEYVLNSRIDGKAALRLTDEDYLQIGGNNGFDLQDMTIVTVLNVDQFTATNEQKGHQILSRKKEGSGDHNWYFTVTDEHNPRSANFGWKTEGQNSWCGTNSPQATLSTGESHLVIARKDEGNATIFVGDNTITYSGGVIPEYSNAPVYLGAPVGNGDGEVSLNADISEVLIFDRGLAAEEIKELQDYLNGKYGMGDNRLEVDPSTVTGLKGWYDAADFALSDGDAVTVWENKAVSGSHDASQINVSSQPVFKENSPINNKPAVKLEKNTFLEVDDSFSLDNMSIFAVIHATDLNGGEDDNQIFSKLNTVSPWNHNWFFNINTQRFNFGWKETTGNYKEYLGENAKLVEGGNYILNGNKEGVNGSLVINGQEIGQMVGSIETATHNTAPIYIGGKSPGQSMTGYISEIIVFEEGLSQSDIDGINLYLANKWEIEIEYSDTLKGNINIGSYPLRMFSPATKHYRHVLDYASTVADIPVVTADFSGSTVTVTQATTLPGTAKIAVQNGATINEYTIEFDVLDKEVLDLKIPEIEDVIVTDGFLKDQLDNYAKITSYDVLDKLVEGSGTLKNFEKVADGGGTVVNTTSPWNDGLLYETITGASRLLRSYPDPAMETKIDKYIDIIATAQEADGYLSTHAQLENPSRYFDATRNARWYHDAYNFGCLTEAGVNYYKATGKTKLLEVSTKFAEFLTDGYGYGEKDGKPKINMVPSHEGPEEMLMQLYWLYRDDTTAKATVESSLGITIDEAAYGDLVKFWIENRGNYDNRVYNEELGYTYGVYAQDHSRFYEQTIGEGHAVRANLFYTGIASAGLEFKDYTYLDAADTIWDNIVDKQMYITGGVGAVGHDEAYGPEYHLPNDGYCETCAQVAMGTYSLYMNRAFGESKYADNIEKHLYNGALGAIGLDSQSYYYQQPLTDKSRDRWDWIHWTPCCPPMFLKFFSDLPTYIYAYNDDSVYINQFVSSRASLDNGVNVILKTDMPWEGTSEIKVDSTTTLNIRIPEWTDSAKVVINVNNTGATYTTNNGYAVLAVDAGDTVTVSFELIAKRNYSDTNITFNEGKVALSYGPIVYTTESIDNKLIPSFSGGDGNIGIPATTSLNSQLDTSSFSSFPTIKNGMVTISYQGEYFSSDGELQTITTTAIPFFARANRGSSSNFVWVYEAVASSGGEGKRWLASAVNSRSFGKSAAAAFDSNNATFWSAGSSQVPQALVVDLGDTQKIAKTNIRFTSTQAWKYQVLYSSDGIVWEEFADRSTNSLNYQEFVDTGEINARYIAYKFTESAGVGYVSVEDISVYQPESSVNIAQNKMSAASSTLEYGDSVFAMIDGDAKNTRYCPPNGNMPQSVTMDIGEIADIVEMHIVFEKPSDWSYKIEVSDDAQSWSSYIAETTDLPDRTITQGASGRYVRLTITGTTGGVWGSIWEFDVKTTQPTRDIFDNILGASRQSYNVNIKPAVNGTVIADKTVVTAHEDVKLKATADSGYMLGSLMVNGLNQAVDAKGEAIISNVQSDINVAATFVPVTAVSYTVNAAATTGGSISPSGSIVVVTGESIIFTVTSAMGYQLDKLTINGRIVVVDGQGNYILSNIQNDTEVFAVFKQISQPADKVKITAFAGTGGCIVPEGEITLEKGGSQEFNIKAAEGYKLAAAVVNGKTQSVSENGVLIISNIVENTSVVVIFEKVIDDIIIPPPLPSGTANKGSRYSGSSKADVDPNLRYSSSPEASNQPGSAVNKVVNHTEFIGEVKKAVKTALGNKVVITKKNYTSIRRVTIKEVATAAKVAGKNVVMYADTLSADGSKVMGRLYLDFAKHEGTGSDIQLGVHCVGQSVNNVKALFEKFFTNDIQAIHISNEGAFASPVEVAVLLDSSLAESSSFVFYRYNKDGNAYNQLSNVRYWKDSSGYLHFFVTGGGGIIVTDKPLQKC